MDERPVERLDPVVVDPDVLVERDLAALRLDLGVDVEERPSPYPVVKYPRQSLGFDIVSRSKRQITP